MNLKMYKVNAFSKNSKGGNPAGVVLEADSLSDTNMQEIAKEIGYSETAFISSSSIADYKLRFFTPTSEVPLCGHATIASFNLLRELNYIVPGMFTQETGAGLLKLEVQSNYVYMQQNSPIFNESVDSNDLLSCFSNVDFFNKELPIVILSTGVKEIFLPVKSIEQLNELQPIFEEIVLLSKKYDVIGIHAFALSNDEASAYGRNFAPIVGINEESATGTSNGALACYINKFVDVNKSNFILRQGYSMGMPSEIKVKLKLQNHSISEVWVGGNARILDDLK